MASWLNLNLNQSLSSLKGQLTSLASEALADSPPDHPPDEQSNHLEQLAELQSQCDAYLQEIKSLRRENAEFHLQKNASTPQAKPTTNSNHKQNDEDSSWFWDPQEEENESQNVYKRENETLRERVKSLESQISNMKSDLGGNDEINELKAENANLARSLEDLDVQNQQAMEKLLIIKNELQRNYDVLQKNHSALQLENEKLKSNENLEETNEKLHKNIDTLRHKYDNLEKVHRLLTENTEKFQEENLYLSEENSRLLSDLDELHERFENLERASKAYTNNIDKIKEENHELNEENFKLQEDVTRLQNDLEEMTKQKSTNSDRQVGQVSDEKYRELEEKFMQLELQFAENVPSTKTVKASTIRDANAQDVIDKLKFEIVELQNKLNTNEEIKRLNLENDHLRKEIESLVNVSVDKRSLSIDALRSIFDKHVNFDINGAEKSYKNSQSSDDFIRYVDAALKNFLEFKSRNETLEIRVSENSKIIDNLESKVNDLNAEIYFAKSDLALRDRELSEMKNNNDFLIAEIGALKSPSKLEPILEQNEDNVIMLQNELEDCSNLNKSIEAQLENSQQEITNVTTERDELERQLKETRAELSHLKDNLEEHEKCAALQQKLNETKSDLEKLKNQMCTSTAENEKLKIDLNIIDNEKTILMGEISELKSEIMSKNLICEYTKKIEKEKADLEHKFSDYYDMKNNLEIVFDENQQLKNKIEEISLTNQTSHLENELLVKENEIKQLQMRLTDLEKELSVSRKNEFEISQHVQDLKDKLEQSINSESQFKEQTEKLCVALTESKRLYENIEIKYADLHDKLEKNMIERDQMSKQIQNDIADLENNHVKVRQQLEDRISALIESQSSLEKSKIEKEEEIKALLTQIEVQKEESMKETKMNELQSPISKDDHDKLSNDLAHYKDQCDALNSLNASLKSEKDKLEEKVNEYNNTISLNQPKIEEFDKFKIHMEQQLQQLAIEKNELITLVTQKHNENVHYHAEIQRLNEVLHGESLKYTELTEAYATLRNESQGNCGNCNNLIGQMKSLEGQYAEVVKKLEDAKNSVISMEEIEKLQEKNIFLVEKCDILGKNLLQEQSNTKQVMLEKNQIFDKEQLLEKEIERLRRHLLEVEDAHTQEMVGAEQRCQELQTCLAVAEEKAKHSSTLYTSNNIRANQEVETLRNQLRLVEKQRDDIQSQLNQSEDKNNKNLAALTNLQCVLEQFQMDKSRDNEMAAGRLRRDLEQSSEEIAKLQEEITKLNDKLRDSNNGLKAAARLSSQLEARAAQLNDMKLTVEKLEIESTHWKDKYHSTISNQQDKVDKSLIKNLLIGLIQASNQKKDNQLQVLRLLSTVLDFDQKECEKVGLSSKPSDHTGESLAQEFVKFLEKESRPALNTVLPNLLNLGQANDVQDGKPPVRKISRILSSPFNPSGARSDSPSSQTSGSGNSPHHPKVSPTPNLLLDNPVVPISIDNAIMANMNTSPVTIVDTNSSRSDPPQLGFSLFTPIASPDVGVNQTRNTEGAILKNVLKET